MAVMTDEQRTRARRLAAEYARKNGLPINYVKGAWNDSVQAIIDLLNEAGTRSTISTRINTASQPYGLTFTAAQKTLIAAIAFKIAFEQEGVE